MNAPQEPGGRVTISPQVLTTIVRQAALSAEGVQSLAQRAPKRTRGPGRRAVAPGIEVTILDGGVHVALRVNASPDANMFQVAEALQKEVAYAIEHIIGMGVTGVDVTIDDVTFPIANQV